MNKPTLGLGIGLLVASSLVVAPVGPIVAFVGAIGTVFGFLDEEK
jgi:xanthosine utilization system XapX-like protein